MHFVDTGGVDNSGHVGRSDAASGHNRDAASSMFHQFVYGFHTKFGRGLESGCKYPIAAATYDVFEGFEWVLFQFVEGSVEGDLHGLGKLDKSAGESSVDGTLIGQKSHYDGMCAKTAALFHLFVHQFNLVGAVYKSAIPGTDEHMGAYVELMNTVVNVLIRWGESAHVQMAAQLDACNPWQASIGGGLYGISTDFNIHGRGVKS